MKISLIFFILLAFFSGSNGLRADSYKLPDIGDPASQTITPQEEKALGEAFLRRLRQSVELVEDPEITHYLRSLGNRLVAHSDEPSQQFTFFLVREDSINAFAAPGGYIGTHSGLFLAAQSESELAAVLAHEIAHVTQRHLARAYDSASRMNLPTAAAILAAVLIGTQDSEAGQAALMSVQAGAIQQQINFTRSNEKEADRLGMHTLRAANFDPRGMPAFFSRLQQHTRYYGETPPPFLSTHPVTTDRIADARARIEQLPRANVKEALNFQLMQAKLRVLTSTPAQAEEYFERQPAGLEAPARKYGLAQAHIRGEAPERAVPILEALAEADPDRIAYRIALAQAHEQRGKLAEALQTYREALELYPDNGVINQYYSEALVHAGKHEQAYRLLDRRLREIEPTEIELLTLYAKSAAALGKRAQAFEAMGEYYYRNGQTHAAIEQYERALAQPDLNFYVTSRLEARLEKLKQEALEEKAAR